MANLAKKWLRLGQNGHFCIFFYLFPQNEAEIDSEWSISPDSQLFPSFATKASHFWRNLKNFILRGGTLANFWVLQLFKSFDTNVAGNDPQWQIWPKTWLRLGQNCHFCIFFYLFPKMRPRLLRMVNFTWFPTFPIFCHPSISFLEKSQKFSFLGRGYICKFFEFSNFFKSFDTNAAGNDPQWQIWPKKWLRLGQNSHFCLFFYLFPKMRLRLTRNGQFHLIHNFSHLLPPKHLILEKSQKFSFLGGYIGKFFEFSNFFKSFDTNAAGNDPQWQIWPKKWLRLGQNGHFCIFFYVFPQNEAEIDSEWSISPDSQPFPSFAPKHLIFGEIPKIFILGGGTSANFLSFATFSNRLTPMRLEMTHNGKFGQKKWLRLGQNGHFCIFFYVFPQNEAEIDSEWSILPDSQLFPSFATKVSYFWRNPKNFHFGGEYIGNIFLSFPTFSNRLTPMQLEMTHNGKFGQKHGLDWVKTAIFAYFSIFSPKMRLRLLRMVNFTWFPTFPIFCQQSISFLEKSQKFSFLGWGGTSANFLSFATFSNRLTPMRLEMTHNGKFGQKSGLDWVKMAILHIFLSFPPKWGWD